jgi:RNA polymerase sigma-70 factor (ECF subfamily)
MSNIPTIPDETLIDEIKTKDREVYRILVQRYEQKLMRYAVYLIHDEHIARDVVQEAFIKAYINLNSFDTRKSFSSWIYRIVHNEALNSIKKFQKETALFEFSDIPSQEDIEHDFSRKEIVDLTRRCLDNMTISYREPLALYYLEDKSYEEISDILRIPMGTVATRINRAKGIMKTICLKHM